MGAAGIYRRGKELVQKFNSENPSIEVTYRSIPWSDWYQTSLSPRSAPAPHPMSPQEPVIRQCSFMTRARSVRMDDYISEIKGSGEADDFLPNTIDTLRYEDKYVALPWGLDIRVWFYRKDLLEQAGVKPPKSWDELRAAAKSLTKDGKYGTSLPATPADRTISTTPS